MTTRITIWALPALLCLPAGSARGQVRVGGSAGVSGEAGTETELGEADAAAEAGAGAEADAAAAEDRRRRPRRKRKAARAEEKKAPTGTLTLAEQPAVRRRVDLRDGRFELGLGPGLTLGEPFRNSVLVNVKADYHINDWLSLGGVFGFGVAATDTGLTQEIRDRDEQQRAAPTRLPGGDQGPCESDENCLRANTIRAQDGVGWEDALNRTAWRLSLRGTVTPFAGKLALFSRAFLPYDFYGFLGPGFVSFANEVPSDCPRGAAADCDPGNAGTRVGFDFGFGIHFFFTDFLALNVELSDTLLKNNPSGRNLNLQRAGTDSANSADERTTGQITLLVGLSAYLPADADRSR